jgi:hypothetical protein
MIDLVKDIMKGGAGLVLAAACAFGIYSVALRFMPPEPEVAVATLAPTASAVKKVKKVTAPVKSVEVYAPEAKANLKLPPAVIADADKQVTSATTVRPSERSITVTSVLDTATGETVAYQKAEPLPWFAVEARGEARFDYGYKVQPGPLEARPVGRLSVTHNFVQVKGFHVGVNGSVDTDGGAFGGVGIGYRW